jgi:hypothetical protein
VPVVETYTAHSTAIAAVKFNKVYLTAAAAVPSISAGGVSDNRSSRGVNSMLVNEELLRREILVSIKKRGIAGPAERLDERASHYEVQVADIVELA